MIGLMLGVFQLFLRKVLFREVAKRRVWVFGCVVVLPWLIAFVVLFADDAFELVLTWVNFNMYTEEWKLGCLV